MTDGREKLAAYAHDAWSRWMRYIFYKCIYHLDGTITISASLVDRWHRQSVTPYAELSEDEKKSDLAEADKILDTLSLCEKEDPYDAVFGDIEWDGTDWDLFEKKAPHVERPFPWKCRHCERKTVVMTTICYEAEICHDDQVHKFTVPKLKLPVCYYCTEKVFTNEASDQIDAALLAHLNLLTPKQIGDAIKRIDYSPKEFVARTGISKATIWGIMNGLVIQSRETDNQLRRALGLHKMVPAPWSFDMYEGAPRHIFDDQLIELARQFEEVKAKLEQFKSRQTTDMKSFGEDENYGT